MDIPPGALEPNSDFSLLMLLDSYALPSCLEHTRCMLFFPFYSFRTSELRQKLHLNILQFESVAKINNAQIIDVEQRKLNSATVWYGTTSYSTVFCHK